MVATALAFTTVILIARSIVRQVGETQRALATAAEKDLTVNITAHSRDELGVAAEAAGLLIGNMRTFVQWLRTQATNTRNYAEKLADGGGSLQESTNSVASGVEELSAAVEQFSRTLEQIEQNARRQESPAGESSREAQELRDGYAAAAETMATIAQTSADNMRVSEAVGNVGEISTGVLAAIAEQTAGAHEMVDSVRVIKEATDHNRAIADDVSALSQTLTDQSREIDEQVSEYRVDRSS